MLREEFDKTIRKELMEELGKKNILAVPRTLVGIVNIGIGKLVTSQPELKDTIVVDKIDEKNGSLYLTIDLKKLREYGFIEQLPLYIQVLTVYEDKDNNKVITDSFNDPKPWENSNFLIGALPINLALKYSKSFKTCS